MTTRSPFRYFKTSPEIICLAVIIYIRFPLLVRNVGDLLHERGIDINYETVRFWKNRFGPLFAAEIRKKRVSQMRAYSNWQWHLDEVFVKINGKTHSPFAGCGSRGEVLENFVTKHRDRKAALKFLRKTMKRHGRVHISITDMFRSYGVSMMEFSKKLGLTTGRRNFTSHLDEQSGPCFDLGGCELYRNSLLSMLLFTTISTKSATFTANQI
jgi:putative transposase